MSRWAWIFDDDLTSREATVLGYLSNLNEDLPAYLPWLTGLSWIHDGLEGWETKAVSSLFVIAKYVDLEFAIELASAPWVVDGVTTAERPSDFFAGAYQQSACRAARGSAAARQMKELLRQTRECNGPATDCWPEQIRRSEPVQYDGLLMESWFADGLNDSERAFIIVSDNGARDYNNVIVASRTIDLPLAGEVTLWVVERSLRPQAEGSSRNWKPQSGHWNNFWQYRSCQDVYVVHNDRTGTYRFTGRVRGGLGSLRTAVPFLPEMTEAYFHDGPIWYTEGASCCSACFTPTVQSSASPITSRQRPHCKPARTRDSSTCMHPTVAHGGGR